MTLTDIPDDTDGKVRDAASIVIYVCTTCRRSEDPEDYPRPGSALAEAAIRAAKDTIVSVHPLRCLANCKRGCSAVMRRTDPAHPTWTYVFGHLDPAADGAALVEGAMLLANSNDGLLPWRGRPEPLKRGLIARIPPLNFSEPSE